MYIYTPYVYTHMVCMSINLIYFKDRSQYGNFGDELSKIVTNGLINHQKYQLSYNQPRCETNLICIGSYLHMAQDDYHIFGSGVRRDVPNEHHYQRLVVHAVRGD